MAEALLSLAFSPFERAFADCTEDWDSLGCQFTSEVLSVENLSQRLSGWPVWEAALGRSLRVPSWLEHPTSHQDKMRAGQLLANLLDLSLTTQYSQTAVRYPHPRRVRNFLLIFFARTFRRLI